MIFQPYNSLVRKAERLMKLIGKLSTENFTLELVDGFSRPGGGALPLSELPSRLLKIVPGKLSSHFIEVWLRSYDPPVIGRLEKDRVLLDVRTIQDKELKIVACAIRDLSNFSQE
jgi:L-seryl-tRNA(Ser) seleniumtransferase